MMHFQQSQATGSEAQNDPATSGFGLRLPSLGPRNGDIFTTGRKDSPITVCPGKCLGDGKKIDYYLK